MNPFNSISQKAFDVASNPGREILDYIRNTYIKDPKSGQMFPQGLISAQSGEDFTRRAVMGGLTSTPQATRSIIRPLEKVGQSQVAHQIPALTQYEQAMNTGNYKVAEEISKKFPSDARFGVHRRFMKPQVENTATPNDPSVAKSRMDHISQFDQAVDLVKRGGGSLDEQIKAHEAVMNEAKQQLTPQELAAQKGKLDNIINLIQKRLKPEESGLEGILKRLKSPPAFDPGDF